MNTLTRLTIALVGVIAVSRSAAAQDPLNNAKALYEAASYNEALAALDQAGPTADVVEVDKYRALCFLAMGRARDAEASLTHLAMNRPLYSLDGTDASPRLVTLFHDVRKRALPDATKQVYQHGRTSFDAGDFADATKQFKDVVALAETAPPEYAELMGELKVLATGFLRLSEPAASKPEPKPAAETASPVAAKPAPPPAAVKSADAPPPAPTIYDASDSRVKPPVAVERPLPKWTRAGVLKGFHLAGLLELVVDEAGHVGSATMMQPVHVSYDPVLLEAARKWRFQPATLDGRPVKFRMIISVTAEP